MLSLSGPRDVQAQVAARFKRMRLQQGLKQSTVATRSGVSLSSIKRFEVSGEISFASLTRVALVLGALTDFDGIFAEKEIVKIEDWAGTASSLRERGTK